MRGRSVLGWLAGGAIGFGLTVYLVGLGLPANHVATRSREIHAPLDEVTQRVWRVEAQPIWRRTVSRVQVQSRSPTELRYIEHAGGDVVAYALVQRENGRRFESRITSDDLPYGGRWLIALDPTNEQTTRILIREEGVVHSPVFRALSRFVIGHTATMDAYLDDLDRSFQGTPDGA